MGNNSSAGRGTAGFAPTGPIPYACRKSGMERAVMQIVQREFYRSFRGPTPKDEDVWRLVFDYATKRLTVCHEWDVGRHSGVDEFDIAEFLAQEGAPQTALIDELFRPVLVDE